MDKHLKLPKSHRSYPRLIDLSLERMKSLMTQLGEPQNRIPPIIHFVGTNGKGSTLAFLRSILEQDRKVVHCYTSPHLVEFKERFLVAGSLATDSQIAREAKLLGEARLTFFEAATAVAFLLFARHRADYTLLETGLGGRFDATNVIAPPKVAVITPISVDHTKHLGLRVSSIAFEKAGIIKRGSKVVVARQSAAASGVLKRKIAEQGCQGAIYGKDWRLKNCCYTRKGLVLRLNPSLKGIHQYMNAATAAAVADLVLGITPQTIADGIATAHWQGRMERISLAHSNSLGDNSDHTSSHTSSDALEGDSNRPSLWLDGAHNEAGVKSLAATLALWQPKPTTLVVGLTGARNPKNFFTPFIKNRINIHKVIAVAIPNTQCVDPHKIAAVAKELGFRSSVASNPMDGLAKVKSRGIVFGSLYLVGSVLAAMENKTPQSQESSLAKVK